MNINVRYLGMCLMTQDQAPRHMLVLQRPHEPNGKINQAFGDIMD